MATASADELAAWEAGWRAIERDAVATIVHTSGTTANPKGVILTHGNILHNFEGGIQAVDFNEHDLFLSFLPLSHMTERAAGQVVPLGRGCTIAYAEPAIERLPANMVEIHPTVMVAVPRLYERLYARVTSTVEAGPALRQRIFRWAPGPGPRQVREPSRGSCGLGVARRAAGSWRIGSSSTDQGANRRPGSLLRLRRRARCRRRSANSSSRWAC